MANTNPPPSTSHRFFTWMRSLNIQREPGWLGGVAAGIATRLGIDPLIVRGILVVVAVLGGPALLVYAAAWLLLPDLDDKIHLERVIKGELEAPIAGIGVLVLLSLLPVSQGFWFAGSGFWGEPHWGASVGRGLWTLVILGLAVWLVVWIARRPGIIPPARPTGPASPTPPAADSPAGEFAAWREQQAAWKTENIAFRQQQNAERAAALRSLHEQQRAAADARTAVIRERNRISRPNPVFTLLVIGLALLAGGLTAMWAANGTLDADAIIAGLAVLLAVLSLGMLVNGIRGKRAGGASGLAALVVFPLIVMILFPQNVHVDFGGRTILEPVANSQSGPDVYIAGDGNVDMDLTEYYPEGDEGLYVTDDLDQELGDSDDVYLFVVSGNVTVTLPDSYFSSVEAFTVSGGVRSGQPLDDDAFQDEGNSFSHSYTPELVFDGEHEVVLHVFVIDGTVTIYNPRADNS